MEAKLLNKKEITEKIESETIYSFQGNSFKEIQCKPSNLVYSCDMCGSSKIKINQSGYNVCINCGTVLSEPYISNDVRSLGSNNFAVRALTKSYETQIPGINTMIGSKSERVTAKIRYMNKLHSNQVQEYEEKVLSHSYIEIIRICAGLHLSSAFAESAVDYFNKIWRKLENKTKSRSVTILAPVIIYQCARVFGIALERKDLLTIISCTEQEFRQELINVFPFFNSRNQINKTRSIMNLDNNICNRIDQICEALHLPRQVKNRAIEVLKSNRQVILSTTLDIAAASCVGISVLSLGLRKKCRMYSIGKVLGISASAINSRIYKVLQSRKVAITYKMHELDDIIPYLYHDLIEKK